VSLFIEVLVGPLAGTDIYLAQSEVESSAEASPSGPTSITFQNGGSLQTAGTVTLPLITGFMAALTIMTTVVLLKQQTRYSWSRVETTDNLSIHPKPN
jgi:hypothetical protein